MAGAHRRLITVVIGALMALPSLAAAQASKADLPIRVGQNVSITTSDGQVVKGTVELVTPAALELAEGTRPDRLSRWQGHWRQGALVGRTYLIPATAIANIPRP